MLVRGQEVLPGARESLKALEDARIPFVFVTNGGGERDVCLRSVFLVATKQEESSSLQHFSTLSVYR